MRNKKSVILNFKSEKFVDKSVLFLETMIKDLVKKKKKINIALSGGNSPLPIYKKLRHSNLEWNCLNFFIVDERCVDNTNDKSNFGNIYKVFFKYVSSNFYPIVNEELSYKECAQQYQELISNNLKIKNGIPQFDLIILGLGLDGHTASLFPQTEALINNTDLVTINYVPHLKTNRITMTYSLILNSKKILLIAKGPEKKEIICNAINNEYPISKIISSINTILN